MEWVKVTTADAASPVLSKDGMERLRVLYPHSTGILTHCLVDHPLLSFEQLALASERMNPAHVECRVADGQNGGEFSMAVPVGENPADTIRQIDRAGRWVMLRFAEQLPEYAELLRLSEHFRRSGCLPFDSCSAPDQLPVGSLWPARREFLDCGIALGGAAGRSAFRLLALTEQLAHAGKGRVAAKA